MKLILIGFHGTIIYTTALAFPVCVCASVIISRETGNCAEGERQSWRLLLFLSSIWQAQAETQWPSPQFSNQNYNMKEVEFIQRGHQRWLVLLSYVVNIQVICPNFGDLWIKSGWLEFWMYYGIPINQDIKIRPQTWPPFPRDYPHLPTGPWSR